MPRYTVVAIRILHFSYHKQLAGAKFCYPDTKVSLFTTQGTMACIHEIGTPTIQVKSRHKSNTTIISK